MGLQTFAEMQASVRSMLGGRVDQDALIMRGLQFAQHRIARVFHFEELFTTDESSISDTGSGNEITDATITMPSTMRKLHSLALMESSRVTKLNRVQSDDWERFVGDTGEFDRGKPSDYVLRGKVVTLWRVPDDSYDVRRLYSVWPTEIVLNTANHAPSSSATVSLLDHKDDLIIMYATVWSYMTLGNIDKSNYYFAVYKNMLAESGSFDVSEPDLSIASFKSQSFITDHTVPTFGRP